MIFLIVHGHLFQLGVQSVPGLLHVGNLGLERVHSLLSLDNPGLELGSAGLQLFESSHTLGLEARSPKLNLCSSLGQGLHGIRLPDVFILNLLPEVSEVGGHGLELGQEAGTILGLSISKRLHVLQLGGHGGLGLAGLGAGSLQFLNLSEEVLVLNIQPLLGRLGIIEVARKVIQSVVGINNGSLQKLGLLVNIRLGLDGVLERSSGISKISLQVALVLLPLHLAAIEVVNLLSQLGHAVVVLHAKSSKSALVANVQLLKFSSHSCQFSLSLLVELNLSGSIGACFIKSGADILNVLLQQRTVLLSLGSVSSLHLELIINFLHASLEFLDLLGILGGKTGFILNLGGQGAVFLLLSGQTLIQLRLDSIQVIDGLLGHLQISLHLPLGLLNISLDLLLPLKRILGFIQSLLKLSLYSGQMVALVLSSLDVLLGLLLGVGARSLLLTQLANHITLVSDLILQGPDLVILVGSVLLGIGKSIFKVGHLILQLRYCRVSLGHLLIQGILLILLSLDSLLSFIQFLLNFSSHVLNPDSFVNDLLNSRSSRLEGQGEFILLSHEPIMDSLNLLTISNSLVNVSLSQGNLVLVLLLVLSKLRALEVGLYGQPDLHPLPGLGDHVHPDGSLTGVQSKLLVLELLELHS